MNRTNKSIPMLAFDSKTKSHVKIFEHIVKLHKLNRELLDACPGIHDFSIEIPGKIPSQTRWECSICGGEVDSEAKKWYEKGVEHGQLYSSS